MKVLFETPDLEFGALDWLGEEREAEKWLWSGVSESARGVCISAWDKGNKARGTARET